MVVTPEVVAGFMRQALPEATRVEVMPLPSETDAPVFDYWDVVVWPILQAGQFYTTCYTPVPGWAKIDPTEYLSRQTASAARTYRDQLARERATPEE